MRFILLVGEAVTFVSSVLPLLLLLVWVALAIILMLCLCREDEELYDEPKEWNGYNFEEASPMTAADELEQERVHLVRQH